MHEPVQCGIAVWLFRQSYDYLSLCWMDSAAEVVDASSQIISASARLDLVSCALQQSERQVMVILSKQTDINATLHRVGTAK